MNIIFEMKSVQTFILMVFILTPNVFTLIFVDPKKNEAEPASKTPRNLFLHHKMQSQVTPQRSLEHSITFTI